MRTYFFKKGIIPPSTTIFLMVASVLGLLFSFEVLKKPITTTSQAGVGSCITGFNVKITGPNGGVSSNINAGKHAITWTDSRTSNLVFNPYHILIDDLQDPWASEICSTKSPLDMCTFYSVRLSNRTYNYNFLAGHTYNIRIATHDPACPKIWEYSSTVRYPVLSTFPTATLTPTPTTGSGGTNPTPTVGSGNQNACFSAINVSSSTVSPKGTFSCSFNYGGGLSGNNLNCAILKNGQVVTEPGVGCTFKSKIGNMVTFDPCIAPSAEGPYEIVGYLDTNNTAKETVPASCTVKDIKGTLTVSPAGSSGACFSNLTFKPSTVNQGAYDCSFNYGGGLTGNHLNCAILKNGQNVAGTSCAFKSKTSTAVTFECTVASTVPAGTYDVEGYMYPLDQQDPQKAPKETATACFTQKVTGTGALIVGSGGTTTTPTPTSGSGVNPTSQPPATTTTPTPAGCTSTDLPAPTFTAPPMGAALIPLASGTQTLTWNAVSGATTYMLKVDDTSNAWVGDCSKSQNIGDFCNDKITGTSQSVNLINGNTYHVWVGAVNSCGSAKNLTGIRILGTTVACATSMAAPTLIFPNTTTVPSGKQTIKWSQVAGATGYALRINDKSDGWNFGRHCLDLIKPTVQNAQDVCLDHLSTNVVTQDYTFQPDKSYGIWVAAENSCGWGGKHVGIDLHPPGSSTTTITPTTTLVPSAQAICSNVPILDWRPGKSHYTRTSLSDKGTIKITETIALHLKPITESGVVVEINAGAGWQKSDPGQDNDYFVTVENSQKKTITVQIKANNPCKKTVETLSEDIPPVSLSPALSTVSPSSTPSARSLTPILIVGGALVIGLVAAAVLTKM